MHASPLVTGTSKHKYHIQMMTCMDRITTAKEKKKSNIRAFQQLSKVRSRNINIGTPDILPHMWSSGSITISGISRGSSVPSVQKKKENEPRCVCRDNEFWKNDPKIDIWTLNLANSSCFRWPWSLFSVFKQLHRQYLAAICYNTFNSD